MPKRIPIKAAERFCKEQDCLEVIILAFDKQGRTHIVTYGVDKQHCEWAAIAGNKIAKICNVEELVREDIYMNIYTLDCSDCGKPIGYSFYQTEEQENVLCMDCIHRYLFVADLIGLGWIDINRVNNAEGLRYDKCLSVSLTWNKNVYSSVKEIEDGQISEDVETVSYDGEQKPARIG